ncbi:hypothetical protein LDENG_00189820 [Lucifuga dentata]|nr:hypothetical protein LDENG_00189820 [Lucifuga dentata]
MQPAGLKPPELLSAQSFSLENRIRPVNRIRAMTFQLQTKNSGLHGSIGLTDWDMDKEMKQATTTDQFYHDGDDKLNDQYLVQWHYTRISRKKDEWCDPTTDLCVQPNLWLIVDPNLACPIWQKTGNTADQKTLCKLSENVQTSQLEPAGTQPPATSELHVSAMLEKPLQSASPPAAHVV